MKTTMNAPFSEKEEDAILAAWAALLSIPAPSRLDISEMLQHVTRLIEAGHELRRKIADSCYYANRRAFPDKPRPKASRNVPGVWDMAQKIAELGITEDDVEAILKSRVQP